MKDFLMIKGQNISLNIMVIDNNENIFEDSLDLPDDDFENITYEQ